MAKRKRKISWNPDRMKEVLKRRKLSWKKLCECVRVDGSQISIDTLDGYKKTREIMPDTLLQICRYLDCNPLYFTGQAVGQDPDQPEGVFDDYISGNGMIMEARQIDNMMAAGDYFKAWLEATDKTESYVPSGWLQTGESPFTYNGYTLEDYMKDFDQMETDLIGRAGPLIGAEAFLQEKAVKAVRDEMRRVKGLKLEAADELRKGNKRRAAEILKRLYE